MNPLLLQLTHAPFEDVAGALRSGINQITIEWVAAIRHAMPQMEHLTFDELKDSTPEILHAIADALASDDPDLIGELMKCAPAQGLSRFRLHFDVVEVMQEDRLLRSITVYNVETTLGRRMHAPESAALHTAIDVMLQRSVVALVEKQKSQLRAAAETELKFLSYLSHDMNNNLNAVTMALYSLEARLKLTGGHEELGQSLSLAQRTIHSTTTGMRHMLEHERLRTAGKTAKRSAVDLHSVAITVANQLSQAAVVKGLRLSVKIEPGATIDSDAELLSIVLQNLVGNGIKFSQRGAVRIGCDMNAETGACELWVSDEGPGIAPENLGHIFEAFRRGETYGEDGLGLGLAVASQAAKLLGAKLTVQSRLGVGSTFRLALQKNVDTGEGRDAGPPTRRRFAGDTARPVLTDAIAPLFLLENIAAR